MSGLSHCSQSKRLKKEISSPDKVKGNLVRSLSSVLGPGPLSLSSGGSGRVVSALDKVAEISASHVEERNLFLQLVVVPVSLPLPPATPHHPTLTSLCPNDLRWLLSLQEFSSTPQPWPCLHGACCD
jgi:hypothetical protein